MKIKELLNKSQEFLNEQVTICGWILTVREQKNLTFVKLNDGSNADGIQLIIEMNKDKLTLGSSLQVMGTLVTSPGNQPYEIKVLELTVLGQCSPDEYPLAKGKLPFDYLRNYTHLRARTSSFGSIFRIKSAISDATHLFFKNKGFAHVNPNIITINECEGGAGVFQLTEHDITDHSKLPTINKTNMHDWSSDHFSAPTYLTVSSQLQLEALCCCMGSVYTTNKSFRSEHSTTNKHLSEFEHLEIEDAFISLEDLMQYGEDYIKFVGSYILENNLDDVNNLGKFASKGLLERITDLISKEFKRITYTEAIELLKQSTINAKFGDDLSSEMENYLTDYFKSPVFVSHWPLSIKSFYMKQSENNLCENFDLILPYKVGELIGGSMRENDLDKILSVMNERKINIEPLSFYLDLRRFGTVPHGGFGLGLDRMCMLFTGMDNIKDTVAFPVYYKNCKI
jgi:asparaginyl-tRNA synthetase